MGPMIMLAATVVSAAGAAASGVAAANQADYQAQVAKNQAMLASQKAEIGMNDASQKAAELGMQGRANMGKMAAGLASSGLDINTGSPKGVLEGEREITKIGSRDYAKAASYDWWSMKQQQVSAQAESELQKSKSEMSMYAGAVGAGSSLIGGASKLNENYGWFGG
jgi:hypothetical protein